MDEDRTYQYFLASMKRCCLTKFDGKHKNMIEATGINQSGFSRIYNGKAIASFRDQTAISQMIDAAGYHWAGPFKALSILAASDEYGRQIVAVKITGMAGWPSSHRETDWPVMQTAITSNKAVWLWMNADRTQWCYIAVGQKPPEL